MPFAEMMNAGTNATLGTAGLIYGIVNSERQRKEQERLNRQNYDYLRNQYQYRAEDLRKAGLNPVLAVGSGASSPPALNAAKPDTPDFSSLGSGLMKGAQAVLNRRLAESEISLREAQSEQARAAAEYSHASASNTVQSTSFAQDLHPGQVEHLQNTIDLLKTNIQARGYDVSVLQPLEAALKRVQTDNTAQDTRIKQYTRDQLLPRDAQIKEGVINQQALDRRLTEIDSLLKQANLSKADVETAIRRLDLERTPPGYVPGDQSASRLIYDQLRRTTNWPPQILNVVTSMLLTQDVLSDKAINLLKAVRGSK